LLLFCFIFSSRRRHTSFSRDWSSDVCSSDLTGHTARGDNALMSDVLELQDVSVVREGRALVDQVSWSVKEGERWVILGPNGAGKTTLLNIASSYLYPSKGTATILGETLGTPG